MIDPVERRRQVRVEHPPAVWVGTAAALTHLEDRLDRVVAATAGPKAIGLRFEPCLPLRLQRVDHASLQHAIDDHRDTEWAPLSAAPLGGPIQTVSATPR